jgi:hypothetical protein
LGSWGRDYEKLLHDVVDRVHVPVNCDFVVVVAGRSTGWLLRRMKGVPGAVVFSR